MGHDGQRDGTMNIEPDLGRIPGRISLLMPLLSMIPLQSLARKQMQLLRHVQRFHVPGDT